MLEEKIDAVQNTTERLSDRVEAVNTKVSEDIKKLETKLSQFLFWKPKHTHEVNWDHTQEYT